MDKELLTKPFPQEKIKTRDGKKGMVYNYVTVGDVVNRLNEVSTNINIVVKDKIVLEMETIVLVSVSIDGITKEAFGSAMVNGSVGDALKSAHSDALKKAAWLFGVPCIFNTTNETEVEEDNKQGDVGYKCSICNRTITKQVYNYSINNFNKPLCIQHQRRFTAEDMVF